MSFFNKILRGLGFEGEEEKVSKPKKQKVKKEKSKSVYASYNLNKQEQNPKPINNTSFNNDQKININQQNNLSVSIVNITNQIEVQDIIDRVKNNEKILINLSDMHEVDFIRSLDFLSGALYALNKSLQKVDSTIFLIQ